MSLYIIGRLQHGPSGSRNLIDTIGQRLRRIDIDIRQDHLDPTESRILSTIGLSPQNTVDFCATADKEKTDATILWIEVMNAGRLFLESVGHDKISSINYDIAMQIDLTKEYFETIRATRIGTLIEEIVIYAGCQKGSIALVEGGIEEAIVLAPSEILMRTFRAVLAPWDCVRNIAYIWL
jgi:hypothetical protein